MSDNQALFDRLSDISRKIRERCLTPAEWPGQTKAPWRICTRFQHGGFDCLIMARTPYPHERSDVYCGYVRLPADHQDHGKWYDDIPVDAHGGLTFCQMTHDGHWVGFDMGHYTDEDKGWDESDCAQKTKYLAMQLAERAKATP